MPNPTTERSFITYLAPDRRAIVTIEVQEDVSLPVPLERAEWKPTDIHYQEIRTAIASLHVAQDLRSHEIVLKSLTKVPS